uniref:Cytospin-A n=1 Tax=Heterorhabditis bacteriophora TaxID=37862 RepID=A0A1I7WFW2_HETBA
MWHIYIYIYIWRWKVNYLLQSFHQNMLSLLFNLLLAVQKSMACSGGSPNEYHNVDNIREELEISDIHPVKPPHCFSVSVELNVVLSRRNQLHVSELIIPKIETLLCIANIVDHSLGKNCSSITKLTNFQGENVHTANSSSYKMSQGTISMQKDMSENTLLVPPVTQAELLHISSSPCLRGDDSSSLLNNLQGSMSRPQLSRCPGDSRVFPRLSLSAFVQPTSVNIVPQQRCVDEPIYMKTNPFKQYYQSSGGSSRSSRSPVEKKYQNLVPVDVSNIELNAVKALHSSSTSCSSGAYRTSDSRLEVLNGNGKDDNWSTETVPSDEGHRLLENTVTMLELQLRRADNKIIQLERLCDIQKRFAQTICLLVEQTHCVDKQHGKHQTCKARTQVDSEKSPQQPLTKDIESLRFEIEWKDERIEYLQKALSEMESASQRTEDN